MVGTLGRASAANLERIHQMLHKTNQFNLTTRRYALSELQALTGSSDRVDRFAVLTAGGAERDSALAERVIKQDDEVDALYKSGVRALQDEMQSDPELVRAGTRILFVLAALERVGDRANNIAWHTKEMIGTA